jgi:EAL domain-containing protein (putative c-di-GMP-specific phosphodiesterase class I)
MGSWGNITPDQFIPVAEDSGLIVPLERTVLTQIARDLPQLLSHYPTIRIGINFSIHHINERDFPKFIHQWLDSLPSSYISHLDIEITETYFQRISQAVIDILYELKSRGLRIVMDDFGAGESSLSRLHTLPFNALKLDKQFAQQIKHPMVRAIIKATINLAKEFNIDLIVEGVETPEQVKILEDLACPIVQGYLFSQPQPLAYWLNQE